MTSMQDERQGTVSEQENRKRVIVIGAGITGLAAAYDLTREVEGKETPEVLLLEKSGRAGGVISTYTLDQFILELGPENFITDKPGAIELCKELGLEDRLLFTSDKHRRSFVALNGKLHPLPEGFALLAPTKLLPFLSSSLLSWQGKARMALDLLLPKTKDDKEESLAEFIRRRFGEEALTKIAQPMVGGIYTADPEKLSLRATLPRFLEMERKYSSIIKGLIAQKAESKNAITNGDSGPRYSLFASFDKGLTVLVEKLVESLPRGSVHCHCTVVAVERGHRGRAWDVVLSDGTTVPADAVLICTPSWSAAQILMAATRDLHPELLKIEYASSAVLNMIFKRSDIPHDLDGFGFVVPKVEQRHLLACSFSSIKFPNRAPEGRVLLRAFVGGALQHDVFELSDEHIECLLWEDLHTYLGISAVPVLSIITRYPKSMPQYNVGHLQRVEDIRTRLSAYPGLELAGNAYDGVGIPDCISSGRRAAQRVLEQLKVSQ